MVNGADFGSEHRPPSRKKVNADNGSTSTSSRSQKEAMRLLAVILGTFVALFALLFGGCTVALAIGEFWSGMPNGGLLPLLLVNGFLTFALYWASYRLFRGPVRPPNAHDTSPDP
jgi:hypothetical protein